MVEGYKRIHKKSVKDLAQRASQLSPCYAVTPKLEQHTQIT